MVDVAKIAWGAYGGTDGPFYGPRQGAIPYRPPANPSLSDKVLITLAATEGGSPSAINMYDSCRFTAGVGQACEGSVLWASSLFDAIGQKNRSLLAPLVEIGVTMGLSKTGKRALFYTAQTGAVDTAEEQCRVFLGGSSGRKGEWADEQRLKAKTFAAAAATVLEQPSAVEAQIQWWLPRLRSFASGELAKWIAEADHARTGDPIAEAFICGALSFAANNPLRARLAFEHAIQDSPPPAWTVDWLVHVLRWMTSGPPSKPAPAIYPHRYAAIRPVLERLFKIDLPDNAAELAGLMPASEVQWILVHVLAYDLGPSGPAGDGVDGRWGAKSRAALLDFERRAGIVGPDQDGMPDSRTCAVLARERDRWRAMHGAPSTPIEERPTLPDGVVSGPSLGPAAAEPEVPWSLIIAQQAEEALTVAGVAVREGLREMSKLS